jgi:molybdopterin molybdotransferase
MGESAATTIEMMSACLPGFEEAAAIVAEAAARLARSAVRRERVPLAGALGRVLAAPIRSDQEMPPFPRSTRDGFACRARDASAGRLLKVAGSIRAGDRPAGPLPRGAAWEIMTGAAVPAGADAIVMLEHVEQADGKVRLAAGRKIEAGENVVAAGAEARAGDEIVRAGTRLGAAQVAAAAACGFAVLEVFARPRVAILTTGDELVAVEATPAPGQIRNSNAPMLAALVNEAGGDAWILPAARDDAKAIAAALRRTLRADLVLISGGVSAGKFDLVEPVLERLGARFFFTGVRIQPGKPLVFGELAREKSPLRFFGLPGNPISSAATFLLFAAPVLAALGGRREPLPQFAAARAAKVIKGKPGLTRFVPSFRRSGKGELQEVTPVGTQGSGDLAAFARADCFTVVPEGTERLTVGETVRILPI